MEDNLNFELSKPQLDLSLAQLCPSLFCLSLSLIFSVKKIRPNKNYKVNKQTVYWLLTSKLFVQITVYEDY